MHSEDIFFLLIVPLGEMNYGVRHIKLFKIQNHLPMFYKIGFLKKFTKFTEIQQRLSLFYNKVASELWQKFMSNFSCRTVADDCFWK